jgi:hypothetical protein
MTHALSRPQSYVLCVVLFKAGYIIQTCLKGGINTVLAKRTRAGGQE